MKKNNNLAWEKYAAPTVEIVEFAVEAGFAESDSDSTINPWEGDNDGLEC